MGTTRRIFPIIYNGQGNIPQIAPFPGGIQAPLNTWFLGSIGVDRQQKSSAAGLLLSAGACRRYRSVAGTRCTRGSAVNAGSVLLRAEGRGSTRNGCIEGRRLVPALFRRFFSTAAHVVRHSCSLGDGMRPAGSPAGASQ